MSATELLWMKVGAIGQVLGAVGTFFAVIVALQLARREHRLRLRVSAKLGKIVNPVGSTDVVSIDVQNVGLRAAKVDGIGWIGGLPTWSLPRAIRWLVPRWLHQESLYQIYDYSWAINEKFPWRLEPGESRSTFFRREEFFEEFNDKQGQTFFRRIPLTSWHIPVRPRVFAAVDTQPIISGKIAKSLINEMRETFESTKKQN